MSDKEHTTETISFDPTTGEITTDLREALGDQLDGKNFIQRLETDDEYDVYATAILPRRIEFFDRVKQGLIHGPYDVPDDPDAFIIKDIRVDVPDTGEIDIEVIDDE